MATASEVYIAPLPRDYTKDKLYNLCSPFGKIFRYKFVSPKDAMKCAYGFVQFSHPQYAQNAINALNGHVLPSYNRRLSVRFSASKHMDTNTNQQQIDNNHDNKQQHKSNKNNPSSYGNKHYQHNPNTLPFKPGMPSNINNINDETTEYKQSSQNNDNHRLNNIKKQILYYFSVDNMNTDDFLRRAMDKDGWIKIDVILKFNRMKSMQVTKDEIIKIGNMLETVEIKKYENKIRMIYWKGYIPCYELQCEYDDIKKKYDSLQMNYDNDLLQQQQIYNNEITDLQKQNEEKDEMIEQQHHNKRQQFEESQAKMQNKMDNKDDVQSIRSGRSVNSVKKKDSLPLSIRNSNNCDFKIDEIRIIEELHIYDSAPDKTYKNYYDKLPRGCIIGCPSKPINDRYEMVRMFEKCRDQISEFGFVISKGYFCYIRDWEMLRKYHQNINKDTIFYFMRFGHRDDNATVKALFAGQFKIHILCKTPSFTEYDNNLLQQQQIYKNKITDLQKQNEEKDQMIEQLMTEQDQLKWKNEKLKNIEKKYKNLEIKYDELVLKEQSVFIAMNKLEDEHKELEMKYNKLEIEYNEKIKKLDYRSWDAVDVVNWIINLDKLRYNKYYNVLLQNMINEAVDGCCLSDLDKNDLHRLGVTQFKDKRDIYHNLQQLIDNKDASKNKKKQNDDQAEGVFNNTDFI